MADNSSLAFVVPQFPCISHVFTSNEILGLLANNAKVSIFSCRPSFVIKPQSLQEFEKPILPFLVYPSMGNLSLFHMNNCFPGKGKIQSTVKLFLKNCLSGGASFSDEIIAFCIALNFTTALFNKSIQWIHADFGKGSANVAWYLSQLSGIPFSFKIHAFEIFSKEEGVFSRKEQFLRKCQAASKIFAISRFGLKMLHEDWGIGLEKLFVQSVGVRLEALPFVAPRQRSEIPFGIAAIGRLVEKKGFGNFLESLAILHSKGIQFSAKIFGDGPLKATLLNQAQNLGLASCVEFFGAFSNDALPSLLRDVHVLAVPSIIDKTGDMDGIPTVIYEGMALGKAVVASKLSGIPEVVIDGETGVLVPPGDNEALARALARLYSNEEDLHRLVLRARLFVEKFHCHKKLGSQLLTTLLNLPHDSGSSDFGTSEKCP